MAKPLQNLAKIGLTAVLGMAGALCVVPIFHVYLKVSSLTIRKIDKAFDKYENSADIEGQK